jgi:hypothetical protein
MRRGSLRCAIALGAGALGALPAPSLAAGGLPVAFSGNICGLVKKSELPKELRPECHGQSTDRSEAGAPHYAAVIGAKAFGPSFTPATHEVVLTVQKIKDAESLQIFKESSSILAQINTTKAQVVKVGTWAREVRYTGTGGATFVQLTFVASGYQCTELWANPTSRAERLVVARAVAGRLA